MSQRFLAAGKAKRIRCRACGFTARVLPRDVGTHILYHRDVTCPARLELADRPKAPQPLRRSSLRSRRYLPPKRSYCPTCRDELVRSHDTLICSAGCTGAAVR